MSVAETAGGWAGPFAATPKGESAAVIEVDVFAPNGIVRYNDKGRIRAVAVNYEMQWSSDTTGWQSVNYGTVQATADQLGFTHRVT